MRPRSKYRIFTEAYREFAVRRLRESDNVSKLCGELGISRQLLYKWRDRLEPREQKLESHQAADRQLQQENEQLKKVLAEKTLEVDLLKSALERIAARRRADVGTGAMVSTQESGS